MEKNNNAVSESKAGRVSPPLPVASNSPALPEKPLYLVKKELEKTVAGYEKEGLSIFCGLACYKTPKPVNITVDGESSSGKSYLVEKVARFFPMASAEDVSRELKGPYKTTDAANLAANRFWKKYCGIALTSVSKEALKRFQDGNSAFSWNGKILLLTELDSATLALPFLRVMMSDGSSVSITTEKSKSGAHYARLWVPQGRPTLVATTAAEVIEHQFSNRCMVLVLDSGPTRRQILLKVAELHMNGVPKPSEEVVELVRNLPSTLPQVPYANKIAQLWNLQFVSAPRAFNDFIALLRGVTLIHGRNVAAPADYVMTKQIYCASPHRFSGAEDRFLRMIKPALHEESRSKPIGAENKPCITVDDACDLAVLGERETRDLLSQLMKKQVLGVKHCSQTDQYGHQIKQPNQYYLLPQDFGLPEPRVLFGEAEEFKGAYDVFTGDDLKV